MRTDTPAATDITTEHALIEAGAHLTAALAALDRAQRNDLAHEAFILAHKIVEARKGLKQQPAA